jgi:hypothetical protein
MAVDASDNPKLPATKALPDLVVTQGLRKVSWLGLKDFALRTIIAFIDWEHTTKNVKQADQATRSAPTSQTGLMFEDAENSRLLNLLPVPKLGPGKDFHGEGRVSQSFSTFNYGTYKTKIPSQLPWEGPPGWTPLGNLTSRTLDPSP